MARDTDRKIISEAVRLSGRWASDWTGDLLHLTRRPHLQECLVIRYGKAGQIVAADHTWPGIRNGLITHKRERVLAVIRATR